MWRSFGGGKKLNIIGISNMDRMKITITLIEAIIPNSVKMALFVMIKVEKPEAVVRLVRNVAFPTF